MKTARIDGKVEPEVRKKLDELAEADGKRSNISMVVKLIEDAYKEMKKNEN